MSIRNVLLILTGSLVLLSCKNKEQPAPALVSPKSTAKAVATNTEYLFPFMNDAKLWGYMDETGQVVVEPAYHFADVFSEGFARMKLGEKWGYVDTNGKVIAEPQYERARRFADGLAAVRVNRKFGYINASGEMVIEPQFSKMAQGFSHGLAAVPDSTKKFGYLNRAGKVVIPHKFTDAHEFSEGLAAVAEGDKWGFIDTTGSWVLGPQYVWADKLVDGHSLVRIGTQPHVDYALIDRKGEIKFRLQTLHAKTPSDGLIRFELNGKWGFVDRTGKIVIPATHDAAFDFHEGLAAVRIGNGWGYIDKSGKLVINLEYNIAEEFRGGLARVSWPGGNWGYIDQTGRTIWKSTLPGIFSTSSDDAETEG